MKKTLNPWEDKTKVCLNLGSGVQIKSGFVNVDKFYTEEQLRSQKGMFKGADIQKGGTYVQADIRQLPFKDNYADYVEMIQVIEHLPMRGIIDYLKEIYRVMKKGAILLINTNDFDGLALDWLNMSKRTPMNLEEYISVAETIYGNQLAGGEFHTCAFNPSFMNYLLTQAGFSDGKIYTLKKGDLAPTIGSVKPFKKGSVLRNDLIIAEAVK